MLAIATPLPDELSRSFLGRVMRMNGIASEKGMIERLASFLGVTERDRRKVTATQILSKAAGIEIERFVCQHTLVPLRRSINSYLPDLAHGAAGSEGVLFLSGPRLVRSSPYLCSDCVRADLDKYGISYWHREHQLPGVLWCARHRVPLRYAEGDGALLQPPSQCIADSLDVGDAWYDELNGHEVVRRFLAIVEGLLDTHRPYPVPLVSERLRERARARGLQIYPGRISRVGVRLLSDAVREAFPHDWLSTVFAELVSKEPGVPMSQVDGVLYLAKSSASATVYALTCSVLYDSADEALTDLAALLKQGVKATVGGRHTAITDDAYRIAYLAHGGVYREVARQFSISTLGAAKRLQRLGLPDLKERGPGAIRRALLAFFESGVTIEEAAAFGGISLADMIAAIRQAGGGFVSVSRTLQAAAPVRGGGRGRTKPLSPHDVKPTTEPLMTVAGSSTVAKRSCKPNAAA
ncbi:UNVERIFIED_ORG: TniQ family protein [Shinella sp. XGS7]|nr:TniQ family protein [Shinella sp. XGS7]